MLKYTGIEQCFTAHDVHGFQQHQGLDTLRKVSERKYLKQGYETNSALGGITAKIEFQPLSNCSFVEQQIKF